MSGDGYSVPIGQIFPSDADLEPLRALRAANQRRLHTSPYYSDKAAAGPEWWALCAAGEMGETCDAVKKLVTNHKRDPLKRKTREDIGEEIADTVIYLDLLAASLGLDMWTIIRNKFNAVSDRVGSDVKL